MAKAQNETGADSSHISEVCRQVPTYNKGKQYYRKTAGGFKWIFVEDLE